jgi:hypothetical protein
LGGRRQLATASQLTDEELEERILANPKIMAAIREAREHPERLIPYSEL